MARRWKWLVVVSAAIGAVVVAALNHFHRDIAIDSCLDLGGRWNYETKECEGERRAGQPSRFARLSRFAPELRAHCALAKNLSG